MMIQTKKADYLSDIQTIEEKKADMVTSAISSLIEDEKVRIKNHITNPL